MNKKSAYFCSVAVRRKKFRLARGKAIAANDTVHCYNVHDCKGNSDCKTADHSCKGQNSCKGHGFKAMPAAQCLKSNGVIGDITG